MAEIVKEYVKTLYFSNNNRIEFDKYIISGAYLAMGGLKNEEFFKPLQ